MRPLLSLTCALLLAGCTMLEPRPHRPEPTLAHQYLSFPRGPEIKNLNPNPEGDDWLAGGLILPSADEMMATPVRCMAGLGVSDMPQLVDNSKTKYWRGIFAQKHGSCAQASAIAYVFTYEMNRMRKTPANDPKNRYPTHWTYNFVNKGYDRGSWMMWGWEVGKSMGIPDVKTYGTETGFDLRYWPSEYDVYATAVDNRVEKYFLMQAGTIDQLQVVKRYLWNHGVEEGEGGIVSFAAGWSTGYAEAVIPDGQYGAGMKLITSFGAQVNHAVTFVGYDDAICYDFDGDGECSNTKDLNGDGKIDLKDWEVGAFIMANSWGTGWGNAGFIYVPYRLAALNPKDGGIYMQFVYGVVPARDATKTLMLRVKMQHDRRDALRVLGSMQATGNDRIKYYRYYGLQNSGGAYPLNGKDGEPVVFGLDLRRLGLDLEESMRLGGVVDASGTGVGKILETEVVDYVNGTTFPSYDDEVEITKGRNVVTAKWNPDGDPDPEPEPDPDPEPCALAPTAHAGDDVTIGEYCILTLDASESSDDGKIVTYQWTQRSGPRRLAIQDADKVKAFVLIPSVERTERYEFRVTVTDDAGLKDDDRVRVMVRNRI